MMNWMIGIFSLFGVVAASNYSYPRILIIGTTIGKSSIGNVLAGCTPSNESCFFDICDGPDSCTKETTLAETTFLGQLAGANTDILDGNVTLIDSPGFGDSDLDGATLIAEMIDVLKNSLEEVNTILLCFKRGSFDEGIEKMIIQLESIFGRDLWSNVVLEITGWAYDKKSISDRNQQHITEAGTLADINRKLQEHFHLNHSLPGVFIDSNAVKYIDEDTDEYDEVQKHYFFNYSLALWEAAKAMEPFSFFTIDDILNQLHTCQIQNDCLNQVLEERITNIENNVYNINSTVTNNIIELTNDVADNAQCIDDLVVTDSNFNDRIDHFNERLNDNTMKIVDNKLAMQTNEKQIDTNKHDIGSNANKIDTNTNNIGTNNDDIATNKKTISTLTETTSSFVSYCGYRHDMTGYGTTITYERLVTAQNSFPTGGLDIATGVFTAPTQGTYLVTQNFMTSGTGNFDVYININGHNGHETISHSYSVDRDYDQTGRTLTLDIFTNDKLYLYVYRNDGEIWYSTFCITLLNA